MDARPSKIAKQGSTNAAAAALARAEAEGLDGDEPVVVAERQPPKQRQRQQQVAVKQEPDFEGGDQQLALVPSRRLAAVPGSSSGSKQVLEVCVEPPGGGEWAVTHLQLSQVRGGHTSRWQPLCSQL